MRIASYVLSLCMIVLLPVKGQKLCSEYITSIPIKTSNSSINEANGIVVSMLRSLLIETNQCYYVPREDTGPLLQFLENERLMSEAFSAFPTELSNQFFDNDITYPVFIKTRASNLGTREGAVTEIVFHNTYEGASDIYIEIQYTIAEIRGLSHEIKKDLKNKLKEYFECNELDNRISRLSRTVKSLKSEINRNISNQINECTTLKAIMSDIDNKPKRFSRDNRILISYLKKQVYLCDNFKELMDRLRFDEEKLQSAIVEKRETRKKQ